MKHAMHDWQCRRCHSGVWDGLCQADCKTKSDEQLSLLRRFNGGYLNEDEERTFFARFKNNGGAK